VYTIPLVVNEDVQHARPGKVEWWLNGDPSAKVCVDVWIDPANTATFRWLNRPEGEQPFVSRSLITTNCEYGSRDFEIKGGTEASPTVLGSKMIVKIYPGPCPSPPPDPRPASICPNEDIKFTVLKVELPRDAEPSENNTLVWRASGLPSNKFQLRPDPIDADVNWTITGFPATPETKIVWDPWDFIDGGLDIGYGPSPDLTVTYEDVLSDYDEFMPPDNTWFGEKNVNVTVNSSFTEDHPVWVYFYVLEVRERLSDGKQIAAWYFYWKQGAVTILNDFEYVHDLGTGTAAQHNWTLFGGDTYKIAYCAATAGAMKPVFDTTAHTYTEDEYADHQGDGIHGVAKLCAHEKWHGVLNREVRSTLLGGLGHADSDDDGLSDTRELEIGTDPNVKDTCNLSGFTEGGADYSGYADYADEELFCRWKQDGNSGDESKDWAFPGMQAYNKPGD
jgi:hypothetical protein